MNTLQNGTQGEDAACNYLQQLGYRILQRNYRKPCGEIDIIAQDQKTLVFVEVKSRPRGKMGEGAQAVNREKRRHLRFAAGQYLQSHPAHAVRFDVIEITAAGLRHLKNAF